MKNRARWAGCAAFVAALAVAGCSSGDAATQPPNLSGTNWRVIEIAGEPTFGTLDQMSIDVGSISSTLRLCEGDVAATETLFMRALIGASALSFDEKGNLMLAGDGGDVHFVASR
jgi:hypothetical protein